MATAIEIARSHFSRSTLAALARKGIRPVTLQAVPGPSGSFLDSETAYLIDDNGTGRVRSFREVLALAA